MVHSCDLVLSIETSDSRATEQLECVSGARPLPNTSCPHAASDPALSAGCVAHVSVLVTHHILAPTGPDPAAVYPAAVYRSAHCRVQHTRAVYRAHTRAVYRAHTACRQRGGAADWSSRAVPVPPAVPPAVPPPPHTGQRTLSQPASDRGERERPPTRTTEQSRTPRAGRFLPLSARAAVTAHVSRDTLRHTSVVTRYVTRQS